LQTAGWLIDLDDQTHMCWTHVGDVLMAPESGVSWRRDPRTGDTEVAREGRHHSRAGRGGD
jgi:hypothetical protein